MLIGINPILSPDLLHILASMGHGDDIAIVDANFPGASCGQRVVRLDGLTAPDVAEAILSIMPLDDFVPDPAHVMQVVGDADAMPEAVAAFQRVIEATADNPAPLSSLERFAFYELAKQAFAVVQTGERRLYGNVILKKGVVRSGPG
ncbi:RbsD/FucU domain-containing protein [Tropicimonas sp. TH_r6]|uniref:RbsD/FucU family protein n=1 Tax=Tropicimonas sp. TH_r6 TaxID=3082085 RepID=UPI0029546EBA|nr:RbsD/FucU domain-containing protein [Tropicimonas sp. TH_r6]MDV7144846.1 RbsD/FucU domain-containing protein [Tropicimonas sp. TH_r6]